MRTDSRELLAVGIFGRRSRLGGRIEMLLSQERIFCARVSPRHLTASALTLVVLAFAALFAPRWIALAQEPQRPVFEVASVKPSQSDERPRLGVSPGGRLNVTNATLKYLIQFAYTVQDYQISGGPPWMRSARYDIAAKFDPLSSRSPDPRINRAHDALMMQTLLADRFQLKLRLETKVLPRYTLVRARNRPKLRDNGKPAQLTDVRISGGTGRIAAQKATMPLFAEVLSQALGRLVLNETELNGNYDFSLEWSPDAQPDFDATGPSIFTALQEQLGLKLESNKGPVEMLVIDHAERPDAN
jgi:uncharacterized protein (TIGR03435 family)